MTKIPSPAQAKRIALCWAQSRPINIMVLGRDGRDPYNDPTSMVCIKNGWIAPDASTAPYSENGCAWESYKIAPAGLLALECYLQKLRFDATPEPQRTAT